METGTMGRTLTNATIENLGDLWALERGLVPSNKVRRVRLKRALVDTGSTMLALQTRFIKRLGLTKMYTRRVSTALVEGEVDIYGTVRLTIRDRYCPADVMELPNTSKYPALIGQVPLELLDFVVDPKGQQLIGNPERGGEQMFDLY